MKRKNQIAGAVSIAGALIFIITVIGLHSLRAEYNPASQHMSELAIGPYGFMMLMAFSGLSIGVFSVQAGLRRLDAPFILRMLLLAAAVCLLGAGIYKLDKAPVLHVSLIAAFFVLSVVSMYLLPVTTPQFRSWTSRLTSWGMAAGTALSVSLGGTIPYGIAQRMAAGCILIWLIWVGWQIFAAKEGTYEESDIRGKSARSKRVSCI